MVVTDISVHAAVLAATEFQGSRASRAAVARLELTFPSLSRPLVLRLAGVRLGIQQVRLPKVRLQELGRRQGHDRMRAIAATAVACCLS